MIVRNSFKKYQQFVYKFPSFLDNDPNMATKELRSDRWIDYLTAYNFDIVAIYHSLITRMRGNPHRLMDQLVKKSQHLLQLQKTLKPYMLSITPYTKLSQILQHLSQAYSLEPLHIKLLSQRYLWINFKGEQLFQYMQQHNIKLKVKMLRGTYQLVIFVTPQMNSAYRCFGDVLHVSFNFVPIKRNRLMRTQYVVVFSGVGWNGEMVIFGIGVLVGSSPSLKAQSIVQFLDLMKPLRPVTLISEYCHSIKSTIQKLNQTSKQKIHYFQNWHHTLQSLQKQLLPQPSRKQILHVLKKLLLSFSKSDIRSLQLKIRRLTTQPFTKKSITQILQHTMSYCCKQKPGFVAFQIQANRSQFITQLIQTQIGYCQGLGKFVYQGLQLEKKVNFGWDLVRKLGVEEIGKVGVEGGMRLLAASMSEDVFKKLLYNYQLSKTSCKLIQTQNPTKVKIQQLPPYSSSKSKPPQQPIIPAQQTSRIASSQAQADEYIVSYNVNTQNWQCQCSMMYWAGIPCSHLICAILHFGGSILYYVNQRWLFKQVEGADRDGNYGKKGERVVEGSRKMEMKKGEEEQTSDKRERS